jgi:hypothetical protein
MSEEVIRLVEVYVDAVRRNDADALPFHPESPRLFRNPYAFRKGQSGNLKDGPRALEQS